MSGPNYKYKVKLTPGQGKKGKTAMQVRGLLKDERGLAHTGERWL
jgi:hypothetical protein